MLQPRSFLCPFVIVGLSAGPALASSFWFAGSSEAAAVSRIAAELSESTTQEPKGSLAKFGKAPGGVKAEDNKAPAAVDEKPPVEKNAADDAPSDVASLEASREASLRRTAKILGLDYDTLLQPAVAGKGDLPGPADVPAPGELPRRQRPDGQRLRALVKHALELATEPEFNAIVAELIPSKKVALCLKVINRVGTIVKGKSAESASESNLDDEHDLAQLNPEAFAVEIEEELAERKDAEQLALLQKKQAAELELLQKRQDVARSERSLNRARAAAETAEKAVQEAAQAPEQKPAAAGQ